MLIDGPLVENAGSVNFKNVFFKCLGSSLSGEKKIFVNLALKANTDIIFLELYGTKDKENKCDPSREKGGL